MLTFSHLPTFHGTPPDGVWHQQGSLARYVKNGVAAVVDVNGRVTILPSCLDLVVAYRGTLPECFAWAEGEVERLVGERATPTIQGNYRVVEQGEMPTNEWYTHRGYESKTIHLWTGRAGASVSAFPGRYWVCPTGPLLARFPTLAFPTQHVAMVAVLDAAYPADRAVAYIKSWADRPDGWSMCVDVPGVWEFHKCGKNVGNVLLMRTGWYAVTPDVCYQTFTEAADAVEGAALKPETPTHIAIGQVWRAPDGSQRVVEVVYAYDTNEWTVNGARICYLRGGQITDCNGCTYVGKVEIK